MGGQYNLGYPVEQPAASTGPFHRAGLTIHPANDALPLALPFAKTHWFTYPPLALGGPGFGFGVDWHERLRRQAQPALARLLL